MFRKEAMVSAGLLVHGKFGSAFPRGTQRQAALLEPRFRITPALTANRVGEFGEEDHPAECFGHHEALVQVQRSQIGCK